MILTLEVMGEQATDLGAGCRKVFNAIGGTIGRLPDNDWVFPDPYVSGRHALIRYLNGKFFVEDTSTNGVFINAPDSRLSKTQAHPLRNGDVLYIDAYEITVSIEKDVAAESQADDPFALLIGGAGRGSDHGTEWFGMSEMAAPQSPPPAPRKDALHDVRDHQTAVLAAMRLAFETMLAQFDPNRLQEEFDHQVKKGSILGVPAKLRYCDLYRDKYGDMARDADTSFRNLFGNEFAKAYEEQMERLKARERHPAGRDGKR